MKVYNRGYKCISYISRVLFVLLIAGLASLYAQASLDLGAQRPANDLWQKAIRRIVLGKGFAVHDFGVRPFVRPAITSDSWLGGSGKTFGRGNWESKGKVRTRTDLPRKAKSLFGQRGKIEISVQSPSFDFYVRLSVLHKDNTRLVGGPRIRVRKSPQAFFPPLVGPFDFLIASPSDCEHLLNSWNAYQSLLPTKIICSSADFTSS